MTAPNTLASSQIITLSELRQILTLARSYPSGDNCQPFRFHWNGRSLDIEYETHRGEHRLNPKHLISWMTLGFLLEGLDGAASQLGFTTEVVLPPNTTHFEEDSGPSTTSVFFFRTERKADPLAKTLLQRCTDRREFSPMPLTPEILKTALASCAEQNVLSKIQLKFITPNFPKALENFILDADALIWNDSEIFGDLLHWMRLSDSDSTVQGDGMPWRSLGIRPSERRLLSRLKKYPALRRLVPSISLRLKSRRILSTQLKNCGAIGVFAVSSSDSTSIIQCGRSAMRCWLSLNAAGNGFHPLTLPAFAPFAAQLHVWPAKTMKRYQNLFKAGPEILREAFSFEPGMMPLWMFRTGAVSTFLSSELRTPRRSLEDLLSLAGDDRMLRF